MSDFKGIVKARREVFYNSKSNWGIYQCSIVSVKEISESVEIDPNSYITVKGVMPQLRIKDKYLLTADFVEDPKYGLQFDVVCMAYALDQHPQNAFDKKRVLLNIFTEKQVAAMYDKYEEPYDVFMSGDSASLIKIKGCGMRNAVRWMERFNEVVPLNKLYLELEQYQLTNSMINKLLKQYKSVDLIIDRVKSDPYCLAELQGIGWKTADKVALQSGVGLYSVQRIKSFIVSYLEQQGKQGYSYVMPDELMSAIVENIGEEVPDFAITESIYDLGKRLFWNENKTLIGLKKFWKLESNIADEVVRLLEAPSDFQYKDFDITRRQMEEAQGWEFTDEQINGAKLMMEKNFLVINGGAGSGKSSVVGLMLAVMGNQYQFAQTALSGRAAARLAEVTHRDGYTIHRLLGYPLGSSEKGGYVYHDENQLPHDVIIIDEISMIGGYLFYDLLRSIRSGSKVILLGDTGQLEAIGECNVAHDLINCPFIPKVTLTKCHRQALKSAIITESLKVRNGQTLVSKGWVGTDTRGKLQDLILDCYSDTSNTYHKVLKHFTSILKKTDNIMDIQVLSPVKTKGDACIYQLNLALQALYNPQKTQEIVVRNLDGMVYGIKVGDKVINTRNSYGVSFADRDDVTNVYNGNIGIVQKVDAINDMLVVDFQDIGVIEIDKDNLDNIELAYAVSVHKYQGSECKNVIIALDFSAYTLLTRELLYTAITRAKEKCVVVAQTKALNYAALNPSTSCKRTYLTELLNDRLRPTAKFIF